MPAIVRKDKPIVHLSWAKLIRMTEVQRDKAILKLEQEAIAKDPEIAELIKAAKAQRKAEHIARMQAVADAKRKRR